MDTSRLMEGKKLLIFDCDGVLFDSKQANINYFNYCLKQAGFESVSREMEKKISYLSVKQILDELNFPSDEKERIFNISQSIDYTLFIPQLVPCCDFEELFIPLKKNFHLAVASNRSSSLKTIFKYFKLYRYFDFSVSALDARPKPDPEMLIKCYEYYGIRPEDAVFFGDSPSDKLAAEAASMPFCLVGTDVFNPSIKSISELINYFN